MLFNSFYDRDASTYDLMAASVKESVKNISKFMNETLIFKSVSFIPKQGCSVFFNGDNACKNY